MGQSHNKRWHEELSDEDLAFIKRFVLASGSLKELASVYDVSYPTIRLRLDRLISKVQVIDEQQDASPFERRLGLLYADGKLDEATFNSILTTYRQDREGQQ